MNRTNDDAEAAKRVVRKPYTAPRLISYGHVKDIVQGGGNRANDPGTGRATKPAPCWIAEALFGVDDARTMLLRSWLTGIYVERRRGWHLVAVYATYGSAAGWLLQRGWLPRRPFVRLFDALTRCAFDESAAAAKARRALARQSAAGAKAADAP